MYKCMHVCVYNQINQHLHVHLTRGHHTATQCQTVQQTATHCNTLQHTATRTPLQRRTRLWPDAHTHTHTYIHT